MLNRPQPVIRLHEVSYQYREQSSPTLKSVSLDIFSGEKVAIVGASGSGKSTLLRVINGLVPHYFPGTLAGDIEVAGVYPATQALVETSRKVGTVLQDMSGQFVGMNVAEDIAFSLENQGIQRELMPEAVLKAANVVGMQDFLAHSPHELSGGQKQRVAMAGVLVDDVDILLFDEPLAMLDPASSRKTIELIDSLHQDLGKTIVIVEHRLEDVLHAPVDRIVLMSQGCIIADMPPDELLATDLLEEHGIRPPLHVAALKYAGVRLTGASKASNARQIELTGEEKQHVTNWVAAHSRQDAEATSTSNLAIELTNISAHYPGDENKTQILQDIDLQIQAGSITGILGSNGAGKSTLAKVITGFVPQSSGQVWIDGTEISDWSIARRGTAVGFVLQEPALMLSRTQIKEEIELGLKARGLTETEIAERRDRALKVCGLWPFRNWPISALSHGQKKRLTIATILALEPQVLILDEPTSGQDFAHYTEFMNFLQELNATGVTIVLITHDMHLALEYTDEVVVMSKHKVLAVDTSDRILTDESVTSEADLVTTSLYTLAQRCGIAEASTLVRAFLRVDQEHRRQVFEAK